MVRHIVHLDLDTFFVSVERLVNSRLHGKPVLIGGTSDRGVVASCSYEARQFGVHSAMPMKLALRLCPEAVVVRGDHDLYSKYSKNVTDILADNAPIVEKASIDEHYLDLTGMDKHFGCLKWSHELREKIIKETGLPISFGLASNKTVSKIATGLAKPNGELHVNTGLEKPFLAPLPVRKIPMIGDKTTQRLTKLGISTIGTLQIFPVDMLYDAFGEHGITMWNKANGIDNSPVIPYSEPKSISSEETFDKDTTNMVKLERTLITMVDKLAFELRKQQKVASKVTVKIRYSNFETHTKQGTVVSTASDRVLTEKVMQLFGKLYSRRMLIRLIGVKFSDLASGSTQIDLFDDAIKDINLSRAMDSIRNRFGADAVMKAISL